MAEREVVNEGPKKKDTIENKLPNPIPQGKILAGITDYKWIVGELIGDSSHVYSAAMYCGSIPTLYPAAVKIIPHINEPFWVEPVFFCEGADPDHVKEWRGKKKLTHLGVPKFLGGDYCNYRGTSYGYLVTKRYGENLWKLFLENGRRFPEHTVYRIALQIIDVLEYVHDIGFFHADIKGQHLLLDKKTQNFVYLIDYALASYYQVHSKIHLLHGGTIEYSSRDAHMGVPTMRGDFENLGYNLIQWLCDSLPWMENLKEPSIVQEKKAKAFEDVPNFLKQCFSSKVPSTIMRYMKLLANLELDDEPNYAKFRKIFTRGLENLGHGNDGKLDFSRVDRQEEEKKELSRVPSRTASSEAGPSFVEDNVGTVQDKKCERCKRFRKIIETMEDNSDSEYEICITRKRKVTKIEEEQAA